MRLAIGAGRGRLIRQMLVESTLLFLVGGGAGLALARVMTTALVSLLPALPVPVDVTLALDARAVAFTLGLSLVAAILSGLAPALHASKAEVVGGLKADAQGGPERTRLRNAFVVSQVAFSIVLVVGAGLFGRALQRAATIDPGFDPRGVELAFLDLSLSGYTDTTGPVFAQRIHRARAGAARRRERDGVGDDAARDEPDGARRAVAARRGDADGSPRAAAARLAQGRLERRRARLLRDDEDAAGQRPRLHRRRSRGAPRVVIVNETAARRMWPNQDPLGKVLVHHVDRRGTSDSSRPMTVIGVARDAKYAFLGEEPTGFVYVPMQQQYLPRTTIVARAADGRRLAADIRSLLAAMNPNVPVVHAQTFEEYASLGLLPQRVAAAVAGSLGVLGLLLAAIGIYGVTAYMVTSRTREIGIRIALGAQRGSVVRMVLRQGMVLTLTGAAIGLALAAGREPAARVAAVRRQRGRSDHVHRIGGAVLAIGLAACYSPRAARPRSTRWKRSV